MKENTGNVTITLTPLYWKEGERPEGWELDEPPIDFEVCNANLMYEEWRKFLAFVDDVSNGREPELVAQSDHPVHIQAVKDGQKVCLDGLSFLEFAVECYCRGEDHMWQQLRYAVKHGTITKEKFRLDLERAINKLKTMFNAERTRREQIERQLRQQTKKRRGYVPTDAELRDAHKRSRSWSEMARNLSSTPDKKITDKKVKDLWKDYCTGNGIEFKEKFSE